MALDQLVNNKNLTITKVDKGDTIAIMDVDFYTELAYKHLHGTQTYKLLREDPTPTIIQNFINFLNHLLVSNVIDLTTYTFLLPNLKAHTQYIYFLPELQCT